MADILFEADESAFLCLEKVRKAKHQFVKAITLAAGRSLYHPHSSH